jgi:hypothetical protein
MFISKEYAERMWTNHERRSAQAPLKKKVTSTSFQSG